MNDNVVGNLFWRLLERFGAQGVTFLVSIILARLLGPEIYGTVALVTIIITVLSVFIDSGLGSSLIQKNEVDDLDYSSVFYFNVIVCLILYAILFVTSPTIARFYNQNQLVSIIRVLGLTLIISGFKNIQNAYVSRNLIFKKYFYATLGGTILSAILGIWMAYKGYGVWALVFQNLSNNLIDTIILWFTVNWRPKLLFSFSRLKVLLKYSWKLLASALLDTTHNQMRQLIVGKKYSSTDLAFYSKGEHFPASMMQAIILSIDSVLFPAMSQKQSKMEDIRNMSRKSIKIGSYVLCPMMIGLAACSNNLIRLFLSDEWIPVVPYLRIFCVAYAFYPIHTTNLNAIKAFGRSDIFLKLEIIKKIVNIIIIIISIEYGVYAIAMSTLVSDVISQIINSHPNKTMLNYGYLDQLKDMMPSAILSIITGAVVYCVNYYRLNVALTLMLQVIIGIIVYVGISIIIRNENLIYCLNILNLLLNKIKRNNGKYSEKK